jgi:YidC/Oxa1 family membrane protein insertase
MLLSNSQSRETKTTYRQWFQHHRRGAVAMSAAENGIVLPSYAVEAIRHGKLPDSTAAFDEIDDDAHGTAPMYFELPDLQTHVLPVEDQEDLSMFTSGEVQIPPEADPLGNFADIVKRRKQDADSELLGMQTEQVDEVKSASAVLEDTINTMLSCAPKFDASGAGSKMDEVKMAADCIGPVLQRNWKNWNHVVAGAMAVAIAANPNPAYADEAVKAVSAMAARVDKTGWIGGIANVIESGIEMANTGLINAGLESNTYGISILLFTLLIKTLSLPLTDIQIKSTTRMQQITPMQQKIQAIYGKGQEQQQSQALQEMYRVAEVNPLAGLLPAFAQIPVFISLYRALQNLVGEDRLEQSFLWIPNLEGPTFDSSQTETLSWFTSALTGAPKLGWEATGAFLTLPLILFVSQKGSMALLQPPRPPITEQTDQQRTTFGLLDALPFFISFVSLNTPAGLSIYWIANNILTTLITLLIRERYKDDPLPEEFQKFMTKLENTKAGQMARGTQTSDRAKKKGTQTVNAGPSQGFASQTVRTTVKAPKADTVDAVAARATAQSDTQVVDVAVVAEDGAALPADDTTGPKSSSGYDPEKKKKKKKRKGGR